jgi:hypothetical protein
MTTNWTISKLECKVLENGLANVAYVAHWRFKVTQEVNGETYDAETYGANRLSDPDPENFTVYDDLTKEQVVEWITASMEEGQVDAITNQLLDQIDQKANPVTATLDPPFNTPFVDAIVSDPPFEG